MYQQFLHSRHMLVVHYCVSAVWIWKGRVSRQRRWAEEHEGWRAEQDNNLFLMHFQDGQYSTKQRVVLWIAPCGWLTKNLHQYNHNCHNMRLVHHFKSQEDESKIFRWWDTNKQCINTGCITQEVSELEWSNLPILTEWTRCRLWLWWFGFGLPWLDWLRSVCCWNHRKLEVIGLLFPIIWVRPPLSHSFSI